MVLAVLSKYRHINFINVTRQNHNNNLLKSIKKNEQTTGEIDGSARRKKNRIDVKIKIKYLFKVNTTCVIQSFYMVDVCALIIGWGRSMIVGWGGYIVSDC